MIEPSCTDVVTRLVFADYLEEQGEKERAIAIRRQAQYAHDIGEPIEITIPLNQDVSMRFILIPPSDLIKSHFWMAKYPVTQSQYQAIMGVNLSYKLGEKLPVDSVNWFDVYNFCRRLSHRLSKKIRLPLEKEWQYACRAGTSWCLFNMLGTIWQWCFPEIPDDELLPVGNREYFIGRNFNNSFPIRGGRPTDERMVIGGTRTCIDVGFRPIIEV